jgi:serine/threonine protein kinase
MTYCTARPCRFCPTLRCRLCGYPPFHGSTVMRMFREIRTAHYEFSDEYWSRISEDAKDFIRRLLKVDPSARMTAHEALKHRWYGHNSLHQRTAGAGAGWFVACASPLAPRCRIAKQQSMLDISFELRQNLTTTFSAKWKVSFCIRAARIRRRLFH